MIILILNKMDYERRKYYYSCRYKFYNKRVYYVYIIIIIKVYIFSNIVLNDIIKNLDLSDI